MLKSQTEIGADVKQNGGSPTNDGDAPQKLETDYRYDRDEMLRISKTELSLRRPSYLSTEFDNEDGKFQPDKWLEYRWVCEGVKNRPTANARRKEKMNPEVLDGSSTVLSPQRRGFSSGCRAASPHKNEAEPERLGTNKGNWRSGAGYMLKNATAATDFKPSFQKNAGGTGDLTFTRTRQGNNADRRAAGDGNFKPNFYKDGQNQGRSRQGNSVGGEEKVPEWMNEGPTSMHEMIELKGFDDERKNKRSKAKKEGQANKQQGQQKANAARPSVANRFESSSTTQSNETPNSITTTAESKSSSRTSTSPVVTENQEPKQVFEEPDILPEAKPVSATIGEGGDASLLAPPLLNGKLPNTDAEFAAIMGLLDTSDFDSLKKNVLASSTVAASDPAPCSRLSRFFSTTATTENRLPQPGGTPGDSNNNENSSNLPNTLPMASNSVLRKIFASSSQRSSPMLPEPPPSAVLPGMVRAEDLEKGFQREVARVAVPPSTSQATDHLRQLGLSPQPTSASRHQQLAHFQVSKGNPLGDPQQQAQLMNKLNRFARQQDIGNLEDVGLKTARAPSPMLAQHAGTSGAPLGIATGSEVPRYRTAPQDVALQAALQRSHLDAVFLKNLQYAASQQRAAAMMQSSQPADVNAARAMLASLMASGGASQGGLPQPNVSSTVNPSVSRPCPMTVPSAFMPTSVMRQMTKNNVSVDDKQRRGVAASASGSHTEEEKQRIASAENAQKQQTGADFLRAASAANMNGNNPEVVSKLLQQQYMQVLSAIRAGVPASSWPVPPHLIPQMRAHALAAAQAEQQRLYALAVMRNDVGQAQAIRARILSQQAAAAAAGFLNVNAAPPTTSSVHLQRNPQQLPMSGQQAPYLGPGISQAPDASSTSNVHKYQSPLEKLLQSAGVPTKQSSRPTSQEKPQSGSGTPSIMSRLPPQANCISVEELEKQYASN